MRTTHSLRATTKSFITLLCAYGFIVPALLGQTPFKLRSTTSSDVVGAGNFIIQDNNAFMVRLIINSSGNVGIGITNPTDKLTVAGIVSSTTGGFRFPDGTLQTSAAKGDTLWMWTPAGMHIALNIPPALRNVFIDGNATIGGTLNASTILQNGLPINSSQWTTSGNNISYSNGNVGIGTSNPQATLEIRGNMFTVDEGGVL